MQTDTTKQCSRCKALKRVVEFLPKNPWCCECRSAYLRAYYAANKETLTRRSKEYAEQNREQIAAQRKTYRKANAKEEADRKSRWYQENRDKAIAAAGQWQKENREKRTAYAKAYFKRNRDKLAAQCHANYEANKSKRAEQARAWAKANPDSVRTSKVQNKAKRKGAVGSFSNAEWSTLKRRFNHRCVCCGRRNSKDDPTSKLTADHVVPLARGGTNYISNIQPLCSHCNSSTHHTADYRVQPFTGIAQLALIG